MKTDWWSKSLAGILAGFTLAVALAGLLAWAGPGGVTAINKTQLVMWTIAPVWLAVVALVFLFPSGVHAWAWLGGANVLAWIGVAVSRALAG